MARYKIVCNLDIFSVVGQTLIWLLLTLITFGIAGPFFAYYFVRLILNKTEIHQIG